jgi:hypothetical protein
MRLKGPNGDQNDICHDSVEAILQIDGTRQAWYLLSPGYGPWEKINIKQVFG